MQRQKIEPSEKLPQLLMERLDRACKLRPSTIRRLYNFEAVERVAYQTDMDNLV